MTSEYYAHCKTNFKEHYNDYSTSFNMTAEYDQFIEQKRKYITHSGFTPDNLNDKLKDFQSYCVIKSCERGRNALFEDCGLGKSFQQLEWAKKVSEYTNKPVLILAPLSVSEQTTFIEAPKFGYDVTDAFNPIDGINIHILNYEQLENIDCSIYSGVVLDESSILKNFEGSYRNLIIDTFKDTPYKLACSATPSPNDPMELGNHAEFLNVMSRNEMLAMYFVHDGGDTNKWRLKKHAVKNFYKWVSSWAIMFRTPSDIGFSDEGYVLPPLNYIERKVHTTQRDNGKLFNDVAVSATNFNSELRLTKIERLSQVADIVNNSEESFIVWVKQNEEADELKKLIPEAIEVRGNDKNEYKKEKLLGFAQNKFRVLITKAKIAGFGMNFQNCHNMIFASPDFSFEMVYQCLRRELRFGQQYAVNAYIITTDTMENVINIFKTKEQRHNTMINEMQDAFNASNIEMQSILIPVANEIKTDRYHIKNGDCIHCIKDVETESIGFSIFSPPFAELYTYSDHIEDMGNSKDYNEFVKHFGYLVPELFRVLMSGRNVAVHCMDLPIQKGKEGYIGLRDFSGMILRLFEDAGFIYHSRVTIWKNPVTEMQRTKALGLLHKQIKKDASMSRVGIPDYLLVFRKPGEHLNPVVHQDTDMSKSNYLPVDLWQKYASPIWYDIDYSDTLNYKSGRDEKDEKHICPLQLQTIERAIHLWTNEGDTVLTPFLGIGSEVYQSVKMNRKGIGFELKKSYFDLAARNIEDGVFESNKLTIF